MKSRYLVDTNVISVSAPDKAEANDALVKWMADQASEDRLFISVVVVTEILRGISLLEHKKHTRRADNYRAWIANLESVFADQIIAVDLEIARIAGQISGAARMAGFDPGLADSLIAATARFHDLIVLTRNTRHFKPLGVPYFDPFAELPD